MHESLKQTVHESAGPGVAASPAGHRRTGAFLLPRTFPRPFPVGFPHAVVPRVPRLAPAGTGRRKERIVARAVPAPRVAGAAPVPLSVVSTVSSAQVAAHPPGYSSRHLGTDTHGCVRGPTARRRRLVTGAWAQVLASGAPKGGGYSR
ncbi:hypothetical protein GCM10009535_29480 [Streptomyces thermocarboxydovorans]|uniref:Uncharacterized protein n=1 Tax=Streptomyces thermocarboxydovorans TaxID=59298 RepID=A0ABP3SLX6_9ACTN